MQYTVLSKDSVRGGNHPASADTSGGILLFLKFLAVIGDNVASVFRRRRGLSGWIVEERVRRVVALG